jgi:hypothetical protein
VPPIVLLQQLDNLTYLKRHNPSIACRPVCQLNNPATDRMMT